MWQHLSICGIHVNISRHRLSILAQVGHLSAAVPRDVVDLLLLSETIRKLSSIHVETAVGQTEHC